MERRTGCLQANVEFLQQALLKLARDMQDKAAATDGQLAAARAEIAALKSTIEKLNGELTQMKANARRLFLAVAAGAAAAGGAHSAAVSMDVSCDTDATAGSGRRAARRPRRDDAAAQNEDVQ